MKLSGTLFSRSLRLTAALCVASVAASAADAPTRGLVLHFDFDQATDTGTIPDRSGLKNDGASTGAKQVTEAKRGKAWRLPADASIRVSNSPSLNPQQFTLSAWFKVAQSAPAPRALLDKGGYALGIGGASEPANAKDKLFLAINGKALAQTEKTVTDDRWHHVAATFDGAVIRLYLDVVPEKQEVACAEKPAPDPGDLIIGRARDPRPGTGEKPASLDGTIDEIAIFDRALSADEVKSLALAVDPAAGKPKYSKRQVLGRYAQLKRLFEEGLLTDDFFEEQVKELEGGLED